MLQKSFIPKVSLSILTILLLSPLTFAQLSLSGVGKYAISGVPTDQEGLSGITWAGGNQYYAIEDSGGRLHSLTINIDPSSGAVVGSPTDTAQVTLTGRTDAEGVAYAGSNTVYVSDETGATITKYNVTGGSSIGSVSVPDIYTAYRTNNSLESLTRQSNGSSLWTANEEALYGTTTGGTSVDDGPISTTSNGTVVRLQKFDSNLDPAGQWAYVVDPILSTFFGYEVSGVSDLLVLPNGNVLVLERQLHGLTTGYFENRIYEIDFTGATDTSAITSLNGATYTSVTKNLLWSGAFLSSNFEGLSLGPQLDDGSYSLLMISDGDGDPDESLYALKLTGEIPEPVTILMFLVGLGLIRRRNVQ